MEHSLLWYIFEPLQWGFQRPYLIFIPAALFTAASVVVFRSQRASRRLASVVSGITGGLWFVYGLYELRVYWHFHYEEHGDAVRYDMVLIGPALYAVSLCAIAFIIRSYLSMRSSELPP